MPASGTWIACKPGGVRLQLQQPLAADQLAAHAVGLAALEDVGQPREFFSLGGDDHLAAEVEGHALGLAELLHRQLALAAVLGLERAGLVVDARVEDAGVVARLVGGDVRFFFEQSQRYGRGIAAGKR